MLSRDGGQNLRRAFGTTHGIFILLRGNQMIERVLDVRCHRLFGHLETGP